jgi:hypothetical protein
VKKIEKEAELEKERAASVWKPLFWRRSQMILVYILCAFVMLVIIEFSYSAMYADNQFAFLAAVKVIGIVMDLIVSRVRVLRIVRHPNPHRSPYSVSDPHPTSRISLYPTPPHPTQSTYPPTPYAI